MSEDSKPVETSSMYPELHDEVSALLDIEDLYFDFNEEDDDDGCMKSRVTSVMGKFKCRNKKCRKRAWSSKTIAVVIRMYPGASYNVKVYHQHCNKCEELSKPKLNDSYADRTSYWIKKWCGIAVQKHVYMGKSKAPHNSDLCEGCKDNNCPWVRGQNVFETLEHE